MKNKIYIIILTFIAFQIGNAQIVDAKTLIKQ
jgi:hypothetical protein